MELILGKQFKLEVWEACLQTMKVKEVAEFTCDAKVSQFFNITFHSLHFILGTPMITVRVKYKLQSNLLYTDVCQ